MKTIYTIRLFVIAVIAMMTTSAFAQDALPVPLSFSSEGGIQSINISETNVNWKLTCEATWVQFSLSEGTGAANVTVTVAPNATEQEREAIIMLDTGYDLITNIFLVKQKGKIDASVTTVSADTSTRSTVVTTLSGTKVKGGSQRRGIYIVNGKKVIR